MYPTERYLFYVGQPVACGTPTGGELSVADMAPDVLALSQTVAAILLGTLPLLKVVAARQALSLVARFLFILAYITTICQAPAKRRNEDAL